ncbi:hypothetical protein GCM10011583_20050 [Streptomyces camponoticapitis]|uniref:Uncharacterized protein n=1 Tax=Streptomyces camponoticapitis TaxID=1616125 RepID=A0ABQ2E4D7_9ACTN|nr:hypothetical protein GCM10011583_20050 [Streptomyces camponoticapitis]
MEYGEPPGRTEAGAGTTSPSALTAEPEPEVEVDGDPDPVPVRSGAATAPDAATHENRATPTSSGPKRRADEGRRDADRRDGSGGKVGDVPCCLTDLPLRRSSTVVRSDRTSPSDPRVPSVVKV